jgi:hypothetical protein
MKLERQLLADAGQQRFARETLIYSVGPVPTLRKT